MLPMFLRAFVAIVMLGLAEPPSNALMALPPGQPGGDGGDDDDDDDDDEEEDEEEMEDSEDASDNETEMVVLDPDHVSYRCDVFHFI